MIAVKNCVCKILEAKNIEQIWGHAAAPTPSPATCPFYTYWYLAYRRSLKYLARLAIEIQSNYQMTFISAFQAASLVYCLIVYMAI